MKKVCGIGVDNKWFDKNITWNIENGTEVKFWKVNFHLLKIFPGYTIIPLWNKRQYQKWVYGIILYGNEKYCGRLSDLSGN